MSIVSKKLELSDPNPDIHLLFNNFNKNYFRSRLTNKIELKWSSRMTVCAGVCTYDDTRKGCPCLIQLSVPILSLRSRRNLVETLLHEMIHAYIYTFYGDSELQEHGPKFISYMKRINERTGTNITIYHGFDKEVSFFQSHWWRCTGKQCKKVGPNFGIIKKSINRAPGPSDGWWEDHKKTCRGKFTKIKEPEWKASVFSCTRSSFPKNVNKNCCPSKSSGKENKKKKGKSCTNTESPELFESSESESDSEFSNLY